VAVSFVGNTLVNGIPTAPGAGNTDQPGFGQACFQSGGVSDCLDIATGVETVDARPIGTAGNDPATAGGDSLTSGAVTNDKATVAGSTLGGLVYDISKQDGTESTAGTGTLALPAATLANGLPGATNFVPNDVDPVRVTGAIGKYFDVTLTATGTTTLDSAVTVDRFAIGIGGGGAMLNVTSTGSLTSLIDITQATGTMQVNGVVSTPGDYLMVSGGLNGTGTIKANYFTSAAGVIAPGTATTIGTLNFQSNLVLTSHNAYLVNLGPNGTSDRIAVTANGANSGAAGIGGVVVFSPAAGYTIRYNDTYTILTATGGITGTFTNPASFSAILRPTFTYSTNAVTVKVVAGTYASVVANTPIQRGYAQLLDQNRGPNYNELSTLYGVLDLADQATIQSTFESWAPRSEQLGYQLDRVAVDNMSRFLNERIGMLGSGQSGTVAMIGQPLSVLASATTPGMVTDAMASMQDGATTAVAPAKLPEGMSAYIAGGYLRGDAAPMPSAMPLGGRNDFDGYYLAAGIETDLGDGAGVGLAGSYTHLDGSTPNGGAKSGLVQFSVYGKAPLGGNVVLDAQAGFGSLRAQTSRIASLGGTTYTLRSSSQPFVLDSEVGLSAGFDLGSVRVAPRGALRAATIRLGDTQEYGGPMALRLRRHVLQTLEGRLGLTVDGGDRIHPYFSGYYVHDFQDGNSTFGANFIGGVGPFAAFGVGAKDKDWFEVSGGLAIDAGAVTLSIGADTTIGRDDVSNQSYRGAIKFRF
jgi:hypothetical protein